MGHERQPEVNWCLVTTIMYAVASKGARSEKFNFRLPFVAHVRLCLRSLTSFVSRQVPLSSAVSRQIISEFRTLTDICDVLSSLDIAIGFLSSTGGPPDMLLNHYLGRVLRMPQQNGLRSLKVWPVNILLGAGCIKVGRTT